MALLKDVNSDRFCVLETEHLVGRSSRAALQLERGFVSSQHASLRWTGAHWELKDLGSRNGTMLDGTAIKPGHDYPLVKGARIVFGDAAEQWELTDDSAPRALVVPLDLGPAIMVEGDLLGIPSAEDPQATIYRGGDGRWRLERPDSSVAVLVDQQTFDASGRQWRFSCPELVVPTSSTEHRMGIDDLTLHFSVSRDEEHVELQATHGATTLALGSRSHNYLLLTLARARLEDARGGVADTTCGWIDQEQLLTGLTASTTQLNVEIFRIRKQFARAGLVDAAGIIERRPRAKQLRIGVRNLTVAQI